MALHMIFSHPTPERRFVGTVRERNLKLCCHRLRRHRFAKSLAPLRACKHSWFNVTETLPGSYTDTFVHAERISNSMAP